MYDIFMGEEIIGSAEISKEGLYYAFSCRCSLTGDVPMTISVEGNQGNADLGLCVPMGTHFGIHTKIPIKKLGDRILNLQVRPKHRKIEGTFIPIRAEEPFQYIDRLESAFLAVKNKTVGVVLSGLKEKSQGQWDNDRNR